MRQLLYICALVATLSGCSQRNNGALTPADLEQVRTTRLPAGEYSEWIKTKGNPLQKEQVIGDLTYRITRMPADMLALREAGKNASAAQLAEARAHYTGLLYFRLEVIAANHNGELLKKDLENAEEYNRRVTYASFGVQKDLSIRIGRDSLACAMCQFERSFDVAPVATFLLAFDADEKAADKNNVTLVLNDQLFNKGIIRFAWKAGELNAYPALQGTNN